jgi:hypothetical protein
MRFCFRSGSITLFSSVAKTKSGPSKRWWRSIARCRRAATTCPTRATTTGRQDRREFDLARVEAIQVAGIYVTDNNPLHDALKAELRRIAHSDDEDEMLRGWAQRCLFAPVGTKQAGKSAKRRTARPPKR